MTKNVTGIPVTPLVLPLFSRGVPATFFYPLCELLALAQTTWYSKWCDILQAQRDLGNNTKHTQQQLGLVLCPSVGLECVQPYP